MNWLSLFQPFIALSLLRLPPQALPASAFLCGLSAAAFVIIGIIAYVLRYPVGASIAAVFAETVLIVLFVWIMLRSAGFPARLQQTLTALFGYNAVLGFLVLPLHVWFVNAEVAKNVGADHLLVMLAILAWDTAIRAHIFRHAVDRPLWIGVGLSLTYFFIAREIIRGVLGALGALDAPAS